MATEEKKPFIKSVVDTVTGFLSGGATGAIAGGIALAAGGALVAGASLLGAQALFSSSLVGQGIVGSLAESVAKAVGITITTSEETVGMLIARGMGGVGHAVLAVATTLGAAGAILGGTIGTVSGAVTGWVNSRPSAEPSQDLALAHQQELARAQATGMVQGATLASLEQQGQRVTAIEQEHAENKFQNMHPSKKAGGLFAEQIKQERAAAVASVNMPATPAIQ